ncbi:uncharacterized protein LOC119725511 [Patiria miniata]|uniref:Ig-like domain-containing protein n=1 Tax=Patiria miniata TaxID=46514 RepID=A0A913ZP86_PATMI|nr:uncharacterized protein LOC119725511 [Patiria miniata]
MHRLTSTGTFMMTWSPSQHPLLLWVILACLVVGLITTNLTSSTRNIPATACPHAFANDTLDAFGLFNNSAYVQLGLTHRIPCLAYSYRENDTSPMVIWYKLNKSPDSGDIETQWLITYNEGEYTDSDRYSLTSTSDFGLHIKGVEESDGGKYRCEVKWFGTRYTDWKKTIIDIEVIGYTFPHGSEAVSEGSPPSSLEQGRRHTLQCECASQTPDAPASVVYWSTGEDIPTDTQIIGARFSNGTTLQIQHGADYSIGSDASLTINSLNDVPDTQRFWCHVFMTDGAPHSCSTGVFILQDGNPNIVLKASPTEFYLPEGFPQVLPCRSWTPGDVMCGVQWIHEHDESSQRVVLSYNLSTDTVEADPDYDLAIDFGLRIKSVNHTHGGRYTCCILYGLRKAPLRGAIDTHVIGHTFPPGSGVISEASTPTSIERGRRHMLPCGCASQTNDAPPAVYWSMGEGNTTDTQIIGARFSDGTTLPIQHGTNYSIGSNASLTINSLNDVQDTQRFWCHVFQSNGTLHSCSTDVQILHDKELNPDPSGTLVYIFILIGLFVLVLVLVVAVIILVHRWCKGKRPFKKSSNLDTKYTHVPILEESTFSTGLEEGARNEARHDEIQDLNEEPLIEPVDVEEGHTLPQDIGALPGFENIVMKLLEKDNFIGISSNQISTNLFKHIKALTKLEKKFGADLGKAGLFGMINGCEKLVEVSCDKGNLTRGIEMGLLCDDNSTCTDKVTFTNKIFQEFCAGMQLALNAEGYQYMQKINVDNWEKLANVLVFATNYFSNDDNDGVSFICHILSRLTAIIKQTITDNRGGQKAQIQAQRLAELCLKVVFNRKWNKQLDKKIHLLFHEGQLCFLGISSHSLRLLTDLLEHTSNNAYKQNLRSVKLFCIDEKLSCAEFTQYNVEYFVHPEPLHNRGIEEGATEEAAIVHQQKESQESPKDRNVLHALQSLGLQDLIDTQSGDECHSSDVADEFAFHLPKQKNLEKIVLLGPILGSQQLSVLISNLDRLKHLQQLDLRLNTQTDDSAFKKIMTWLSGCKELIDLRLSLYKVTSEGFKKVTDEMEKDATVLRRLQTLYLLHGRLSQSFGKFLTDTIKYTDNLQCFHTSALDESGQEPGIIDSIVEEIRGGKPKLKELVVDNKHV